MMTGGKAGYDDKMTVRGDNIDDMLDEEISDVNVMPLCHSLL